MWHDILKILLGDMDAVEFIAYFIAMGIGAVFFFSVDVWNAVKLNPETPRKFNFRFLVMDNFVRALTVIIAVTVSVLFFEDLYDTKINVRLAFWHGFGIDAFLGSVIKQGKRTGPFKKNYQKLINKYKNQ